MMDDPCDEWKPPFWGAFFVQSLLLCIVLEITQTIVRLISLAG